VITYCTNIHPGESWDEIFHNLRTHLLKVKEAVSPDKPFAIGLRLSNKAASEMNDYQSSEFLDWCHAHNCFVPTINGFPFGSFHSSAVKENVYMPDWRSGERVEYSKKLATLLDSWLPQHITGSLSTVPVGFRRHVTEEDYPLIRKNLISTLEHCEELKQQSGKKLILSLEPEPGCILETTGDVVRFFERMQFPEALQKNIGICLDCCHHAVAFENPEDVISILYEADINIGKIQVSSALRIHNPDHELLQQLSEPCYLHQVVIRQSNGILKRYNDITEAISSHQRVSEEEWRIHYHVPVFIDRAGNYETTQFFIEEILSRADTTSLLEVETYTWDVLPQELKLESVTDSIIREIQWVKEQVNKRKNIH